MEQLALLNPENVTDEEVESYSVREAVRAVVVDGNNLVALLHVTDKQYYKLPGGGIEGTENRAAALARECIEEIGSEIEVIGEIGSIVEFRRIFSQRQTSYCYFAKLKGQKGTPKLTEDEIKNGFEQVWLPYQDALKVLSDNRATSPEGKDYIVPRGTVFLQAAKEFIFSSKG